RRHRRPRAGNYRGGAAQSADRRGHRDDLPRREPLDHPRAPAHVRRLLDRGDPRAELPHGIGVDGAQRFGGATDGDGRPAPGLAHPRARPRAPSVPAMRAADRQGQHRAGAPIPPGLLLPAVPSAAVGAHANGALTGDIPPSGPRERSGCKRLARVKGYSAASSLPKSAGMTSGIAIPSSRATRSETSRRTKDRGMSRAAQIANSSSEEASFCPRSTSERYPKETRAADKTSRRVRP